jgi:hypothetical protein
MGEKIDYPWRVDYFYSSPILYGKKLIIGGDDGILYKLDQQTGKPDWKFKTRGLVRSTPALMNELVLFGDTEGDLYAIDEHTGKQQWVFKINGESLNLDSFGFDRKAILAAPVVYRDKIIFGARDGYLYCVDHSGKQVWVADHQVSWIISTVAVKDTFVVTGTSDGRFVQAVNVNTGKEIWRFRPNSLFWSSPLIVDDKVYAGSFDGVLYCLDLRTGQRISQFCTGSKILSSPVWDGSEVIVGSDDGKLYALSGHADQRTVKEGLKRFVYHDPAVKFYFRNGGDWRLRNFLVNHGFNNASVDTLALIMAPPSAPNTVVVFASSYFPVNILRGGHHSILRSFLDAGGRVILPGTNPLIFSFDERTKQPFAFNFPLMDSILGLSFKYNDTRAMDGQLSSFATEQGKAFGLPAFWDAPVFLRDEQVDLVLGRSENGRVSAYAKSFSNNGAFIQLYLHPELPVNMDAVIKLAEWRLK